MDWKNMSLEELESLLEETQSYFSSLESERDELFDELGGRKEVDEDIHLAIEDLQDQMESAEDEIFEIERLIENLIAEG